MLCAHYDKSCDSRELFAGLEISKDASFEKYLNKFNVIYLDITLFTSRTANVRDVIHNINNEVMTEVCRAFDGIEQGTDLAETLVHVTEATGERFIMVIDEWDALFREAKDDVKLQIWFILDIWLMILAVNQSAFQMKRSGRNLFVL